MLLHTDKIELKILAKNPLNISLVQKILDLSPTYSLNISGELAGPSAGLETFETLPPKFERDSKFVLGIYLNNEMIGVIDYLKGYPSSHVAYLGLLVLVENHQAKYLGRAAFQEFEKMIYAFGYINFIKLSVLESNSKVIPFWKKMGFKETGEVKPYQNQKVISKAIIFEKNLSKN